jgi:hypothetical protein
MNPMEKGKKENKQKIKPQTNKQTTSEHIEWSLDGITERVFNLQTRKIQKI